MNHLKTTMLPDYQYYKHVKEIAMKNKMYVLLQINNLQ